MRFRVRRATVPLDTAPVVAAEHSLPTRVGAGEATASVRSSSGRVVAVTHTSAEGALRSALRLMLAPVEEAP